MVNKVSKIPGETLLKMKKWRYYGKPMNIINFRFLIGTKTV